MANPWHHAVSSAKKYGGVAEDYLQIHAWFDESKQLIATPHHRMLRHHAFGIFECEQRFGATLTNSAGRVIPTRWIGEQHVTEDIGFIPSFEEWVLATARAGLDDQGRPRPEGWMWQRAQKLSHQLEKVQVMNDAYGDPH
jgi:hypothetical protein